MDDYISRDAAQDAMTADNLIDRLDTLEDSYSKRYARAAIRVLERIPAADVRPVVRGENIGTVAECDQFICSKCGIHLEGWVRVEIDEDDGDITHHEYVFNICPNCGADIMEADHEP